MPMGYMSSGRGGAPRRPRDGFQRNEERRDMTCPTALRFFGMQRQPVERPHSGGQARKTPRVRYVQEPLAPAVILLGNLRACCPASPQPPYKNIQRNGGKPAQVPAKPVGEAAPRIASVPSPTSILPVARLDVRSSVGREGM